jgi:hypothetical protein
MEPFSNESDLYDEDYGTRAFVRGNIPRVKQHGRVSDAVIGLTQAVGVNVQIPTLGYVVLCYCLYNMHHTVD